MYVFLFKFNYHFVKISLNLSVWIWKGFVSRSFCSRWFFRSLFNYPFSTVRRRQDPVTRKCCWRPPKTQNTTVIIFNINEIKQKHQAYYLYIRRGMLQTFSHLVKNEGISSLWSGLTPVFIWQIIFYNFYDNDILYYHYSSHCGDVFQALQCTSHHLRW